MLIKCCGEEVLTAFTKNQEHEAENGSMEERQDEQRMNCRIIDIHTHIYPVALARRAMEVTGHENDDFKKLPIRENLLARMREAGVDLSVNLPVVSKPQNQGEVNRFAKETARRNMISFGGLHPDCENVIEELEKLKDMEMAGIKFHPPFPEGPSGRSKVRGDVEKDQ